MQRIRDGVCSLCDYITDAVCCCSVDEEDASIRLFLEQESYRELERLSYSRESRMPPWMMRARNLDSFRIWPQKAQESWLKSHGKC